LLRGRRTPTGFFFGAIPYAEPPLGPLRYRAPQPAGGWDGAREASAPGPALPQPERRLPGLNDALLGGWDGSEPQLTLNVWTPDPATTGLPVLVWLHGGAFVAGSPGQPVYDGAAWTRDGVVLVTVAYRLGVEGFVAFEGGETNVALRDQLAALEWVHSEIECFGGDPARVCLAGQSAGAMSLGWLLGSPRSRALFSRAISMSGGVELTYSPEQARRVAAVVAARAGTEPTAEAMRDVPIERVIALQADITAAELELETDTDGDPTGGLIWVLPVRDGDVVAEDPLAALGRGADVQLLAGDTSEEGRLYLAGVPGFDEFPETALEAFAARMSSSPQELLASYRRQQPDAHAGDLAARVITDTAFAIPTARLRERHAQLGAGRTYGYRFTWRSGAIGGRLGAAHAVDLPFVFDTLQVPGIAGSDDALLGERGGDAELATRIHRAWVQFATDGSPGWAPHPHVELL
jgi:para-nitrobenzyl esterase